MIKAILIDDEPLARSIVKEYLRDFPNIQVIDECDDGFEGVKSIMLHQPDLIFLDIQMPKINGFEMLELIENQPDVIFTTAFDEYAIRAFEAHAIDYLLKPYSKERFNKAINKWLESQEVGDQNTKPPAETINQLSHQHDRVVVKTGSKITIIPVMDIEYLEASDDYVMLHTSYGRFLKNKTMQFFEQTLSPQYFVRIHRSYIVQIPMITRLAPYEKDSHVAILKSDAKIPVSRTGYGKLKQILGL